MKTTRYRWFVLAIFFGFMLLHQADKLLIGPLTTDIMKTYNITKTEMGAVFTGALVVGAIFYPLWGYLYDRFTRAKLLSLASFIWGATTWISAIAPTYRSFLATRASTGIDDSSYPGLYSLVSDYFPPRMRGKIYGLLELTMPLGYLLGMVMALVFAGAIGWRSIFYITGSAGILISIMIFFFVREAPRGSSEPEFEGVDQLEQFRFNWQEARQLFKKRSLQLIFLQGFFGVFPWNVISYWFFAYLETERGYSENEILLTMVPAVLILATGYLLGGAIGDRLFKKDKRGRTWVASVAVLCGAILLTLTMIVPLENTLMFGIFLAMTAIFIPMASPNMISSVYDITLPEVRSSALSIQYCIESAGAALAPLIAGRIADQYSLGTAILGICVMAWVICAILFFTVGKYIPEDIRTLRQQLAERAAMGKANETVGMNSAEAKGKILLEGGE